jgi:hypothetical protein
MQQLDFKDFYRFIASLGLAIVLAGLLFPWLLLHDSSLFVVPQIQPISQTMQVALDLRAAYLLFAVNHLISICATLICIGFIITGLGLFLWWRRQQTQDTKENLELEKLKRELKPLTKEQSQEKAVAESSEYAALSEQEENSSGPQRISMDRQSRKKVSDYQKNEELVLDKLEQANSANYEILKERALGAAQYDAVLLSKLLSKPDIIVEVKIIRKGFHWSWLSSVIKVLALSVDFYSTRTRRKARGLLLVVAPTHVLNQDLIRVKYHESIRSLLSNIETDLAVHFIEADFLHKKNNISNFSESFLAESSVNFIEDISGRK